MIDEEIYFHQLKSQLFAAVLMVVLHHRYRIPQDTQIDPMGLLGETLANFRGLQNGGRADGASLGATYQGVYLEKIAIIASRKVFA